ncbi:MAG: hypothetical protein KDB69_06730 [Acidimicrobiia bacterium]|nr:hypothetical protein [Acidimicrobiia bacterium]
MRIPDTPDIRHFVDLLDERLRHETVSYRRSALPRRLSSFLARMRTLLKPLAQTGALALTAVLIIVAFSVAPSPNPGPVPRPSDPLAAPETIVTPSRDVHFADALPPGDVLAMRDGVTPGEASE